MYDLSTISVEALGVFALVLYYILQFNSYSVCISLFLTQFPRSRQTEEDWWYVDRKYDWHCCKPDSLINIFVFK